MAIKEGLWTVLQELTDQHFKEFKWLLKGSDISGGHIPEARLDGADRQDTVDLMVQKYYGDGALEVTAKILEKLDRNDLSQRLRTRGHQELESQTNKDKPQDKTGQIQQMIEERQKKISEIKKSVEISSKSAEQQIRNSGKAVALLRQFLDENLQKLTAEIDKKKTKAQEEANVLIQELERELTMLTGSTKMATPPFTDHNNIIAQCSEKWTEVHVPQPSYGHTVLSAVNQMKEKLNQHMETLFEKAKPTQAQQFTVDVTLDPDTAHPNLILSPDGKQVSSGKVKQNLPDDPGRFNVALNVLANQSFSSGKFYYEVQVEGKTSWDLGVVRESINRKGSINVSPENGFWTIGLRAGCKYHPSTVYRATKSPLKKVGIYVDYDKRSVTFFDVDSANILHYFKPCFFEGKVFPFFSPGIQKGHQNTSPLIISPIRHKD